MSEALGNRVLTEARSWIGTPYRHQASRKAVGCDCLGLVRGVWRALYGVEPEQPRPYTPDWAEAGGREALLEAARRYFIPLSPKLREPGDLLVFRWRSSSVAKHCGIFEEGRRLIHAYQGSAVLCSPLAAAWERRIAGVFRFPHDGGV